MAVFYLDDSGTHAGSKIVVFGGLIGEQAQWEEFEPRWKAKLANPLPGKPPLKRFHMAHCQWGWEEFESYSKGERDRLIHDFRQIILDCGVHGVSAAISKSDYDELITGRLLEAHGAADDMAFASAISALDIGGRRQEGVSLICDDTGKSTERYGRVYDRYQAMHTKYGSRPLEGLAFRSMEKVIPLQGADMIAWETYFYTCEVLKTEDVPAPRPHLKRYVDTGRFGAVFLSRDHILEFVRRLKRGVGVSLDWWATWPPS
ncbi:MAG: DUF3800 domain-containing protein [bacterium]|nr:DUF3800 domain-containing protein [bacterium]